MTSYEAAKKWKISTTQICKMLRNGKIKAERVKNEKGRMVWNIPDDHPAPAVSLTSSLPSERTQKAVLYKYGKRGFIAKYAGTFSTRHIAQMLETTCAEVRAIYDEILEKGGGMW